MQLKEHFANAGFVPLSHFENGHDKNLCAFPVWENMLASKKKKKKLSKHWHALLIMWYDATCTSIHEDRQSFKFWYKGQLGLATLDGLFQSQWVGGHQSDMLMIQYQQ